MVSNHDIVAMDRSSGGEKALNSLRSPLPHGATDGDRHGFGATQNFGVRQAKEGLHR
jgi:hypothetical protein